MNKLDLERKKNKILYRELFFEADKTFKEQLYKLKGEISCSKCKSDCEIDPDSFVTTAFPKSCSLREWQKICIEKIKTEIEPDIYKRISDIENYRHSFNCSKCATCCNLACSEYSYDELKQKAAQGDVFAGQFTSVFIPYENLDDARKIFPDYVDLVKETLDEDETIYFYHCPHLTEDKTCSIYEKRPGICRDFPENPLSILPPTCGFHEWKEEVMVGAMMLHAMTYIYKFYQEKIEEVL